MTEKKGKLDSTEALRAATSSMCAIGGTALGVSFFCRSIGALQFHEAEMVNISTPVEEIAEVLSRDSIGAILVVDRHGKLSGLITETDFIKKVTPRISEYGHLVAGDIMTQDPVAEEPTVTIALALTLMSHGGFRHLPLVDGERHPIGVITVKDIIDAIVQEVVGV